MESSNRIIDKLENKKEYFKAVDELHSEFETLYITVRKLQNRLYSDEQLLQLPGLPEGHPLYYEWLCRKITSEKLLHYIANKKIALNILEVGCGNGWLANKLAQIDNSIVAAIDINKTELQQAARVFDRKNLSFIYGDIRENIFPDDKFDIIVFAASIQYFPFFDEIINTALLKLNKQGEIHIIDSHFYKKAEQNKARERSYEYFSALGFPEMTDYYYHHKIDDLRPFHYKKLYDPTALKNKILKNKNPFPWICIFNR